MNELLEKNLFLTALRGILTSRDRVSFEGGLYPTRKRNQIRRSGEVVLKSGATYCIMRYLYIFKVTACAMYKGV